MSNVTVSARVNNVSSFTGYINETFIDGFVLAQDACTELALLE